MSERVIYRDSSSRLSIEEDKDGVTVQYKIFPLKGYANNYGFDIEIYGDKVVVYEFRDNWNGTGSRKLAHIEDNEFAKQMLERVRSIKSPDEFEKVIELVQKKEEEVGKEIDELIGRVLEEIENIDVDENVRNFLKSSNAKERIKEMLYEYFSDP